MNRKLRLQLPFRLGVQELRWLRGALEGVRNWRPGSAKIIVARSVSSNKIRGEQDGPVAHVPVHFHFNRLVRQ
jgi:hypothetical protein